MIYPPPIHAKPLSWERLAAPLARAEDALARLDQCLATSPIRAGWIARAHFADALAGLSLEGGFARPEDLILHDADMDIRAPTPELIRAHAILSARRRIAEAGPDWTLLPAALDELRGKTGVAKPRDRETGTVETPANETPMNESGQPPIMADEDSFTELFASVDAAIARTDGVLAGAHIAARPWDDRAPLLHDPDQNEDGRLGEWRAAVDRTADLPPTLAAALALDAWETIAPLPHLPWIGRLLAAALLRQRGKTRHHLPCLGVGLRTIPRERRRAQPNTLRANTLRLTALLDAMTAAAQTGLADHDRWMLARTLLLRKLDGRRSSSKLPDLIEFVLSRPLVSAGMIAKALGITPRAAQNLVAELSLRETTGRGRYRAWSLF